MTGCQIRMVPLTIGALWRHSTRSVPSDWTMFGSLCEFQIAIRPNWRQPQVARRSWSAMFGPLAQLIDWLFIQTLFVRILPIDERVL